MEFSTFIRPTLALIKGVVTFIRRPLAERRALKTPEKENHSLYSIIEKTLVHIGVEPSSLMPLKERWLLLLERKIVISEPFTLPHVIQWLNLDDTQTNLKYLAVQKLTHEISHQDSEQALIKSYMSTTGEIEARARDVIHQAVTTIVTGTLSGLQDPKLGILLKVHSHALHEHIDELSLRLLPEEELSLLNLCTLNAQWLTETLSSKVRAKTRLGQALCPGETGAVLQRTTLRNQFSETLSALPVGGIVVVTGAEGNGKSWLVAQSWLSLHLKPLTAFIRAEDIEEPYNNIGTVVINALCRNGQTDALVHAKFWQQQFRLWDDAAKRPISGLVVIVDGINQRPTIRWAQFIDRLSEFLELIGGKLIVTSRQLYFTETVETRLASPYARCIIPEWSADERDEILALSNIKITGRQLSENVAASLCNPRLLGIALNLFDVDRLQDLQELSIALLLFEHIKASKRDSYDISAERYSQHLQLHGKEVLLRFQQQRNDDIDVFEADLQDVFEGGLLAVADGRFFTHLPEDTTRYRIHPEGLSLALGLAVLEMVNKAARNNKDLDEVVASVIEPVMALDKTSDTLFAALTVACLDRQQPEPTGVAILVGFASLQNPDTQFVTAFEALSRLRPEIFLIACEQLALCNKVLVHHHWIEAALIKATRHPSSTVTVLNTAAHWLEWVPYLFPSSPVGISENIENKEDRVEGLNRKRDEKVASFSTEERELFDTLVLKEVNSLAAFHLQALKLLAGTPLLTRIGALVKWSFARSLMEDYGAPWEAFRDLITFNGVDWKVVRENLEMHWSPLVQENISDTGKWAAIALMMATGHSDDAQHAETLSDQIRDKSHDRKGWHINESWCEADPCNPENPESTNLSVTDIKHSQLDVSKIYNKFGIGYEETFFNGAAISLARYRPQVAIGSYLRLVEDVLQRSGMPLRQGIFALKPHKALITPAVARQLVERVISNVASDEAAWLSLGDESDMMKQFQLSLAFPQLSASEQLSVLKEFRYGINLLMPLVDTFKTLDWDDLKGYLLPASSNDDTDAQSTFLLFHPGAGPLPLWLVSILPKLLDNQSSDVRNQTFRMLMKIKDKKSLDYVTKVLTASERQVLSQQEQWYCSALLFQAVVEKVTTWKEVRPFLKYTHLAQLAGVYGGEVSEYSAEYFDVFLNKVLNKEIDVGTLQLTLTLKSADDRGYALHHLCEVKVPERESENDVAALFKNQDIRSFKEQQQSLQHRYDHVKTLLSELDLSELTDHFYPADFAALVAATPDRALVWAESLLDEKNADSLRLVRHAGLVLAQVLSNRHPALSVQLFERLDKVVPFNHIVFTAAGIDLSAVAVWSASDSPEIIALRWRRLYRAENNDVLAHEVWAAHFCHCEEALHQFIHESRKSPWPVHQARSIMVSGYLGQNSLSESMLKSNVYSGLLEGSFNNANNSYQRHLWTLHWFRLMQQATSAQAFWCASLTFLQVVDERFLVMKQDDENVSVIFNQYWPYVVEQLGSRFSKLRRKRAEHLFGNNAPWPGFIEK